VTAPEAPAGREPPGPGPQRGSRAAVTDPRSLIVFAVVAAIIGVFAAWLLFAIRDTIVSVYVSALFAMGISPLVKLIERQRAIPIVKRLPRWLAILIIYATIIAVVVSIGMIIIPPLIDQAEELWRSLPERFAQAQASLVRAGFRRLLNDPSGDIALGQNTHELVTRLLSALPLASRRTLISTDGEFHTIRRQLDRFKEEERTVLTEEVGCQIVTGQWAQLCIVHHLAKSKSKSNQKLHNVRENAFENDMKKCGRF